MKAENLFHLGIVSDEPETVRDELSTLLGYEWGPEVGGSTAVSLPGGESTVDLRCAYSIGTPRLEVVASVPGTLWQATPGIHHLGYWSDDVDADCADLRKHGYTIEATRETPSGGMFFAFARSRSGLLVELVTREAEQGLSRCWATQDLTSKGR